MSGWRAATTGWASPRGRSSWGAWPRPAPARPCGTWSLWAVLTKVGKCLILCKTRSMSQCCGAGADFFVGRLRVHLFGKQKRKALFLCQTWLKGIVSREFRCLQMILMGRIWVPDVPLEVYLYLNFRFYIIFLVQGFEWFKLLLLLLLLLYIYSLKVGLHFRGTKTFTVKMHRNHKICYWEARLQFRSNLPIFIFSMNLICRLVVDVFLVASRKKGKELLGTILEHYKERESRN